MKSVLGWVLAAAPLLAGCQADPYAGLEARSGAEAPAEGPWAYRRDPGVAERYEGIGWSPAAIAVEPVVSAAGIGADPESARSAAVGLLAERIRGLPISGRETVGDRIGERNRAATLLAVFAGGARILGETEVAGGAFVARAGVGLEDLRIALRQMAVETPGIFEADEIDRLTVDAAAYEGLLASSEGGLVLAVASPSARGRVDASVEAIEVRGVLFGPGAPARLYVRNAVNDGVVEADLAAAGPGAVRFALVVPLAAGKNELEVVGVDGAGGEARIAIVVFRSI